MPNQLPACWPPQEFIQSNGQSRHWLTQSCEKGGWTTELLWWMPGVMRWRQGDITQHPNDPVYSPEQIAAAGWKYRDALI